MGQLDKLEMTLDGALDKNAPVKIPPNGRKTIAMNLWWAALVVGLLQLWAAWALWNLGHTANKLIDYGNTLLQAYGQMATTRHLGLFFYLSVLSLAVSAALLLLATPGLKAMRKAGWDLLFYSVLVNAVAGVVLLFSNVGGGPGGLVQAVIGSVLGAYVLFQVREHFMKSVPAEHKSAPKSA